MNIVAESLTEVDIFLDAMRMDVQKFSGVAGVLSSHYLQLLCRVFLRLECISSTDCHIDETTFNNLIIWRELNAIVALWQSSKRAIRRVIPIGMFRNMLLTSDSAGAQFSFLSDFYRCSKSKCRFWSKPTTTLFI